ncbi:MAG: chromosomal replication initiator protein DnaA, partial [Pseudomonadota bacterium]
ADRYQQRIARLWILENPTVSGVVIVPHNELAADAQTPTKNSAKHESKSTALKENTASFDDFEIGAKFGAQFQFQNFVVGEAQRLAAAAAQNVIASKDAVYNPVYISAPVGYGKTHLIQAIANAVTNAQADQRKLKYISAQKFMHSFVTLARQGDTSQLKKWFAEADIVLIDDVHHLAGKTKTQEELYYLLHDMLGHQCQVVVTGNAMPMDLEKIDERLRSRLAGGLVTAIGALDFTTRLNIIALMADERSIELSKEVLQYVARRIKGSPRDLSGALNRLSAHLNLLETRVTVELCDKILHDLIAKSPRQLTVERIQRVISDYYAISQADMLSKRRNRNLVRPRQVAMYYTKQLTSRSLPDIGRRFGDRDHTTVMHALRKVEDLQKHDAQFKEQMHDISRLFDRYGL